MLGHQLPSTTGSFPAGQLTRAEIALIRRLRPENVDAWGCYRQGVGAIALKGWTEEAMQEPRTQLRRAFELDPSFALARALFALHTAMGSNTELLPASIEACSGGAGGCRTSDRAR